MEGNPYISATTLIMKLIYAVANFYFSVVFEYGKV